ncbi:egg cell-secreted protein 1.1 [Abrus precatorius]|uniref:Egg cell-secreted protein 1.1 n=1 Tax=Abrus precatorius TaxID=3816 RepID=A0A8B8MA62_ABRPR|nr:egg cell-secreted protein 1.1 [Abrus precatorius]
MASIQKLFGVTILLALTIASPSNSATLSAGSKYSTLGTRLKLDGESTECWDSLFELQACTGEVITFFLNGEAYLGPSCCQAIRVVGHECWPDMLLSLGFTSQEDDILKGFCDHQQQHQHSPPSPTVIQDHATKLLP